MSGSKAHVLDCEDYPTLDSLESLSTGLWSFDLNSRISNWSPSLYRLLGREIGDYPTHQEGGLSLIHPSDQDHVRKEMTLALSSLEHELEYFCRMLHADGRWLPLLCKGRLELDGNGKPSRLFGSLTYIASFNGYGKDDDAQAPMGFNDSVMAIFTSQQSSRLSEVEYRLRMALTNSSLAVFDWDLMTDKLNWDRQHEALWGFKEGAFSGELSGFFDSIHPVDLPTVIMQLNEARNLRAPFNCRFRVVWPDKSQHWIQSRGEFTYDRKGDPIRMLGTVADVTIEQELQIRLCESEERFRALFDYLPLAYQALDAEGKWLYANPALANLLGYRSAEELIGLDFSKHFDRDFEPSPGLGVLGEGVCKLNLITRDSHSLVIEMASRKQSDFQGAFIRQHCILIDVTERDRLHRATEDLNKELEKEVRQRTAKLEELLYLRSQFLAHMSHEIRNPMNVIGLSGHLLSQSPLNDFQKGSVDRMIRASEKLMKFVDEILDYSKLESGEVPLVKAAFELKTFLKNFHLMHEASAKENGLCLTVENYATLTHPVGDERRIGQVLDNLVGNAIKCTKAGSIAVRVSSCGRASDHDELLFEVIDTGCGIEADNIHHLFQPFKQVGNCSVLGSKGAGLGLSICKGLVTLMGGEIDVESTPGVGSRFWFTLPVTST